MKVTIIVFFFVQLAFPQAPDSLAKKFVLSLTTNSSEIVSYINPDELKISERFGINYYNIENKYFIGNDIPVVLRNKLSSGNISYKYEVNNLSKQDYILTFKIPSQNLTRNYFIRDSFIISPEHFYSKDWEIIISDHFKFFISDKNEFNAYSIKSLEDFIDKMITVLKFTNEEQDLLKNQKIYYFLCKNEEEIKKVTGFETKGMYVLAQDYIVTTYNTHFHEILHFLINFKLRSLHLYTHPFLQEGFAVSLGGRGGLDVSTILNMGALILKSGFVDYKELLSKTEFINTDASISYPVSGIYVSFLIKHTGIENLLSLYREYSGLSFNNLSDKIETDDLTEESKFKKFIDSVAFNNQISIYHKSDLKNCSVILKKKNSEIYQNTNNYFLKMKDTLLIKALDDFPGYQSKLFKEYFPLKKYNSEKYLIIVNENEISIYNLFTNNLIGKYIAGFTSDGKILPDEKGLFEFKIDKHLFDENLETVQFKSYDDQ